MDTKNKILYSPYRNLADARTLYSGLTALCLCMFFISVFLTNGRTWQTVFFYDGQDTGMDFFNSIAETSEGVPYSRFGTLYPPLANAFFYVLQRCIPNELADQWAKTHTEVVDMRGTAHDLRSLQAPLMIFIAFTISVVLLLYFLLEYKTNSRRVALSCCGCYGILYAIERGNIISLALVLTLFFCMFYNSERYILREMALISLAVAAGLKLYPAVFGLILLKDRMWKAAIRTVIYGICCFVFPFFLFEGVDAIKAFFQILFGWNGELSENWIGYGIDNLISGVFKALNMIGISLNETSLIRPGIKAVLALLLLMVFFRQKEEWKTLLSLTLLSLYFQPAGDYALLFFLIPFSFLIRKESLINRENARYYICFAAVLLPYITPRITQEVNIHFFVVILAMALISGFLIWETGTSVQEYIIFLTDDLFSAIKKEKFYFLTESIREDKEMAGNG